MPKPNSSKESTKQSKYVRRNFMLDRKSYHKFTLYCYKTGKSKSLVIRELIDSLL